MLLVLSGTTRSSLTPTIFPRPPHTGQAPSGLLKLNRYSSGCRNTIPSFSKREENSFRVPDSLYHRAICPLPLSKADWMEEVRRVCISASREPEVFTRSTRSIRPPGYLPSIFITSSIWRMLSSAGWKRRPKPSSLRESISSTLSSLSSQRRGATMYRAWGFPSSMAERTSFTPWAFTSSPLTGE